MPALTGVFSFDNRRYSVVHPGPELSLTDVSNFAFWGCRVNGHTRVPHYKCSWKMVLVTGGLANKSIGATEADGAHKPALPLHFSLGC